MAGEGAPGDDKKFDWMIDLLGDLRSFSKANGFELLAKELESVSLLAAVEISNHLSKEVAKPHDASEITSQH